MEKLAKASGSSGALKVGAMDCGKNDDEARFCKKKGIDIDDLPQFAFVVDGKANLYPADDTDYSAKAFHTFCMENMPKTLVKNINHVAGLQEKLLDPLLARNAKQKSSILLLTDKYETSSLYYGLAYKYRSSFLFGESRAKNLNVAKEFGVKKYPLLLALVPKGKSQETYSDNFDIIRYDGSLKDKPISDWIDRIAKKVEENINSSSSRRRASQSENNRESNRERQRRRQEYG